MRHTLGFLAVSALAQTTIPIAFSCTAEDIEHFGLNCSAEQPCAVYADFNSIESGGARVFLTGNLHTDSVTLYSLLLASDDAGVNWKEVHDRVKSGNLDQIQFVDFQNGWISGGLMTTLPRDPFFLVTMMVGKRGATARYSTRGASAQSATSGSIRSPMGN